MYTACIQWKKSSFSKDDMARPSQQMNKRAI